MLLRAFFRGPSRRQYRAPGKFRRVPSPFRSQERCSWRKYVSLKVTNKVATRFVFDRYNKPLVFTYGKGSADLFRVSPNQLKHNRQEMR